MIKLVWATPEIDKLIAYQARVSNPTNQDNPNTVGIIKYMLENGHVSPFEMVNACFEINTTRDIGRQILRHRSFSFQEFCVAGNTMVTLELPGPVKQGKRSAYTRSIEHLYNLQERGKKLPSGVRVFDEGSHTFVTAPIKEVFKTGVKPTYRVTLENGKQVECTKEHKFFTSLGFISLEDAVGLQLTNSGKATMSKKDTAFACNGILAYRNKDALLAAKQYAISTGSGLSGISEALDTSVHTIRKWLKKYGIQFTKQEVRSYTPSWNKGKSGYKNKPHSIETIEKMRASAKKGSASNLWRGGADRAERLAIADWCAAHRAEFLIKANYKCSRCGSNTRLELHHKLTVASHPELAKDKDNIEVLCSECHKNHHKLTGDAKVWRERSSGNTLSIHWSKVKYIEFIGEQMTYDMEVAHESHNYVANGVLTHNSQRYQSVDKLDEAPLRECRTQDVKNRQSSHSTDDESLRNRWADIQQEVLDTAQRCYREALENGIAKEQARALLPEGLTATRMYMNGTLRSWIFYLKSRLDPSTQKEHRLIAEGIAAQLRELAPDTMQAAGL